MGTLLEGRCLEFGIAIIQFVRESGGERLTQRSREQLVSSATSIGANVAEARSGQSRADFISKMEIALKEARETDYWLQVLFRLTEYPTDEQKILLRECYEITSMLVASVKTAKANKAVQNAEGRVQGGNSMKNKNKMD